jgi:hypothetical protein
MNKLLNYTEWALTEMHMNTDGWSEEDHKEWANLHMKNLEKFSEIMSKHRANWWLDCGTLLGIHRDKSFIQGDSDSDVGLDVESITPEMLDDLEKHFGPGDGGMFFDYNTIKSALDDDNYYAIKSIKFCGLKGKNGQAVKHKGVPVMMDVFIYYPSGKDMIYKYGSDYFRGKTDHLKGCTSFQFQGIKLKKPSNVEGHLESIFGKGWSEPDPQFSPKTTKVYGGPIKQKDFGGRYMYNFKTKQHKVE